MTLRQLRTNLEQGRLKHSGLPGYLSAIVLVKALRLLPARNKYVEELASVLISDAEHDIQDSTSALLNGQVGR